MKISPLTSIKDGVLFFDNLNCKGIAFIVLTL